MPTAIDYEEFDYGAVQAVLATLTPAAMQAVAGSGWIGIFEAEERIDPAPTPGSDLRNPVMFCRWEIAYSSEPEACLDPDGDVTRDGDVRLALRFQPGGLKGRVLAAFRRIREAFAAASLSTKIVYFPESPSSYAQPQAGWSVRELPIRFKGV